MNEANAKGKKISQTLEDAIDRGRFYQGIHSHFELDQTGAAVDLTSFTHLARPIGVENPVVPASVNHSTKGLEWMVVNYMDAFISNILSSPSDDEGRILLLLQYAGHGKINQKI